MSEGTIGVVRVHGAWRVQVDGRYLLVSRYGTQPQAMSAGNDLARERGVRLPVDARFN